MGKIKINFTKTHDISKKYNEDADYLLSIKEEMQAIYERLLLEWKDNVNTNFNNKFQFQINRMDDFIGFLQTNSKFLDDISNKHKSSEDEFKNNMDRVKDLYEYRDQYQ